MVTTPCQSNNANITSAVAITISNITALKYDKTETAEGITLTMLAKDNKSTLLLEVKLNCPVVSVLRTFLTLEKQKARKSSQLRQEETVSTVC